MIKKKRTSFQRLSGSGSDMPLFNETVVFDMPPNELICSVLLVLVCISDKPSISSRHLVGNRDGPSNSNQNEVPSQYLRSSRVSRVDEEALFHYSDNLNNQRNKNTSDQGARFGIEQGKDLRNDGGRERKKSSSRDEVVGKVAFGYSIKNPIGKYHWEKMMKTPRTVITEWHSMK